MRRRLVTLLVAAAILTLATASMAFAQPASGSSQRFPKPASLSIDWWRWSGGITKSLPPSPSRPCSLGNTLDAFFLASHLNGIRPPAKCAVPAGKVVFAAAINFEYSTIEEQTPSLQFVTPVCQRGDRDSQLKACVRHLSTLVTATSATLTIGQITVPLPVLRVNAQSFTISWVDDNWAGVPAGTYRAATSGYYVQLPPLPPGAYKLSVSGTADLTKVGPILSKVTFAGSYILKVQGD